MKNFPTVYSSVLFSHNPTQQQHYSVQLERYNLGQPGSVCGQTLSLTAERRSFHALTEWMEIYNLFYFLLSTLNLVFCNRGFTSAKAEQGIFQFDILHLFRMTPVTPARPSR